MKTVEHLQHRALANQRLTAERLPGIRSQLSAAATLDKKVIVGFYKDYTTMLTTTGLTEIHPTTTSTTTTKGSLESHKRTH